MKQRKSCLQGGKRKAKIKSRRDNASIDKLLNELYTNVDKGSAAIYTSTEPLFREAKKHCPSVTRKRVNEFLTGLPVYSKHRRVVRKYPRLPTLAPGPFTIWQCDLSDMQKISSKNQGYGYFLVCVDCFSRKLFVEPVKHKSATDIVEGFRKIFSRSVYVPWRIVSDQGKEFIAQQVQVFFKELGVNHHCIYTSPQFHAGMAERANRTIKERLYKYFTHNKTSRWLEILQPLVDAINNSESSSINMRPSEVSFDNANYIRKTIKDRLHAKLVNKGVRIRKAKFNVEDFVRIEKYKHSFEKGYTGNFTSEIFSVCEVRDKQFPVTYKLVDSSGNQIKGWFYNQDLSLVRIPNHHRKDNTTLHDEPPSWAIEKVIRKNKRHGKEYLYVKWQGFSEKYNSWVPVSSILINGT